MQHFVLSKDGNRSYGSSSHQVGPGLADGFGNVSDPGLAFKTSCTHIVIHSSPKPKTLNPEESRNASIPGKSRQASEVSKEAAEILRSFWSFGLRAPFKLCCFCSCLFPSAYWSSELLSYIEELSYGLGFRASGLEGLGLSFCLEGPKGSDKKAY